MFITVNKYKILTNKFSIKTGIDDLISNVELKELSFTLTYKYLPEASSYIILSFTDIELLDVNGVDHRYCFDKEFLEDFIHEHKDFPEFIELGYQMFLEEVEQHNQEVENDK